MECHNDIINIMMNFHSLAYHRQLMMLVLRRWVPFPNLLLLDLPSSWHAGNVRMTFLAVMGWLCRWASSASLDAQELGVSSTAREEEWSGARWAAAGVPVGWVWRTAAQTGWMTAPTAGRCARHDLQHQTPTLIFSTFFTTQDGIIGWNHIC